jgi:hypothetical protein
VGLCDDYPGAVARWGEELRELEQREGRGWTFIVEYHLTGYQGRDDATPVVHPWYSYAADGETEVSTPVRDEDHLHELAVAQKQAEKPDPADYMPVFDVPEPELGWCLYETVSEGTPVTPVFATAEDLIDHLATVGQDHDQQPMRRASAETIVSTGGTIASMVVMGGTLYRSDVDADVLSERLA